MKEYREEVNQLKSKLEEFEHTNKLYETWFVKGLFYAITLIEHGKTYAEGKLSSDSVREAGTDVEQCLDQLEDALKYAGNIDRDKAVALIEKIRNDLYT